ncbi:hypothetical protein BDV27DRAFT_120653 [Aspergillus caelatus]|uniref:Uncharacterized protein n=1 Tax=Aspergillus caelatus TaxID=61420 RepID=A0A5N7AIF9_9EURO|nr:uncharacterized protein BDV27DRAFT_120653 [Aspergillus caelatus]KAE8369667.1 hypothetical protein BDV27DRAFT_120653 [Aspergillus caelatus]
MKTGKIVVESKDKNGRTPLSYASGLEERISESYSWALYSQAVALSLRCPNIH